MFRVKRMRGRKVDAPPTLSWSVFEATPEGAFVRAVAWAACEADARTVAWALNSCEGVVKRPKRAAPVVS